MSINFESLKVPVEYPHVNQRGVITFDKEDKDGVTITFDNEKKTACDFWVCGLYNTLMTKVTTGKTVYCVVIPEDEESWSDPKLAVLLKNQANVTHEAVLDEEIARFTMNIAFSDNE